MVVIEVVPAMISFRKKTPRGSRGYLVIWMLLSKILNCDKFRILVSLVSLMAESLVALRLAMNVGGSVGSSSNN